MAIIKSLKSRVGIDLSYHRVLAVNVNYKEKKVVICLASYVDLDRRIESYDPLEVVDIEVPRADFKLFEGVDLQEMSYLWLKDNIIGFDKSADDLEVREVEADEEQKNDEEWNLRSC